MYSFSEVYLDSGYSFAVDFWAFGIVIFQIITKKMPFKEDSEENLIDIPDMDLLERFTDDGDVYDIIVWLLKNDVTDRLGGNGYEEVKEHLFFR